MAMGTYIAVAAGLSAVNLVLLAVLGVIWARNYRTFRTTLVLALLVFCGVLFVENAVALYYFFNVKMLYSGDQMVQQVVALLRGLQLVALLALVYATWR
jgi:hypothetical protein